MKTTTLVSACLIVGMAGTSALAIDLTTNSDAAPSAVGRYTVCTGRGYAEMARQIGVPTGIVEYLSANQWPSWQIADGNIDTWTTTYGGTSPDFFGYRFKLRAATVTGLYWENVVFWDGGTFGAFPEVQYLTDPDGPWQTVPSANVTWTEASYNAAFIPQDPGTPERRPYHATISPALTNVWGVRLFGNPAPGIGGEVDGFVGVAEVAIYGTPDTGDLDLSRDLAVGATGLMSTSQMGNPNALVDGDLWSYDTTWGGVGSTEYLGVLWSTPQYRVGALGVMFAGFTDGGFFADDCMRPLRVEYTTDAGATWQPVVGLHKGRYTDEWPNLATWLLYSDSSWLFTFDQLNGINGLRIIGKPAGMGNDTDGFVGAYELEVFGAPLLSRIVNYDGSPEGDVDGEDLLLFNNCLSGPKVPFAAGCDNRDLDTDGDVDQDDFGIFQRCFSGQGVAPDPLCGE